jgi:hypothetical protein|tara:strand:+ start:9767 stop:10399 length:633 start_codon:yes stop_codon:yes gene_type:complete
MDNKYSLERIKRAMNLRSYKFFENGAYNVNIIGIRNSATANKVTNKFDDTITISYKDDKGNWIYHEMDCTTDPGTHWVENCINDEKGVAILKPGQYPKSHKIRKHQGRYEALGQQNPVTVYRDNNRDDVYNLNTETTDTGLFGINIHRATKYAGKKSTQVDKWSAGCQVIASNDDWTKFMKICKKARDTWSNNFTYTLLESKDIPSSWLS